jgi:hypothetical protein
MSHCDRCWMLVEIVTLVKFVTISHRSFSVSFKSCACARRVKGYTEGVIMSNCNHCRVKERIELATSVVCLLTRICVLINIVLNIFNVAFNYFKVK